MLAIYVIIAILLPGGANGVRNGNLLQILLLIVMIILIPQVWKAIVNKKNPQSGDNKDFGASN